MIDIHDTIAKLYASGLEIDRWDSLLTVMAEQFGTRKAGYINIDTSDRWRSVQAFVHPEKGSPSFDNSIQIYNEMGPSFDIWHKTLRRIGGLKDKPTAGHKIWDFDEFIGSDNYNLVSVPQDLFDTLIMPLTVNSQGESYLTLYRSKGEEYFSDEDINKSLVLQKHLKSIIAMQERFGHSLSMSAITAKVLNDLKQAVFIVDANSQIKFQNTVANKLIDRAVLFFEQHSKLQVRDHSGSFLLADAIKRACGVSSRKLPVLTGMVFSIDRPTEMSPLAVQVFPAGDSLPSFLRGVHLDRSLALVIVIEPLADFSDNAQLLESLYSLTQSELKIIISLLDGYSQKEVAERLNISKNTMKWHMRNIFVKTQTNNTSELLPKMLKSLSPLR